jgi:hypothetical protein
MMALLPVTLLFFTTDIYEKVKIRRLKWIPMIEKRNMLLIYGESNKNASGVARLCRQ